MDLNSQTQPPLDSDSLVDPTNQFMDLMDEKSFSPSLDPACQNKQRPQLVKWTPQTGHSGDSITVVLKQLPQQTLLHPLKLILDHQVLETEEERSEDHEGHVWITLVAKVPEKSGVASGAQMQIAVCIYDPANQRAVDHWPIGDFVYQQQHQGNKRDAEEASLYPLDTDTYAKKPHTSDYIGSSTDFDQGDFMKLLSPYDTNAARDPISPSSANSALGRLPSPAIQQQGLPKAVSMPDMRKPSIEEPHASYTAMFQGNIPPSPNSLGMHSTAPQQQRQSTNPSFAYNAPPSLQQHQHQQQQQQQQILPRVSPASTFPPSLQNNNNTGSSSSGNYGGYGLMGYPPYQENPMATNYIQQPQPNTAPATAPSMYDSSSNYFPPVPQQQQQQYGNPYGSAYLDQSNIMAAPPLTPPLQQKRLSQMGGMLPPPTQPPPHSHYAPIKTAKRPSHHEGLPQHHPFAGLVSRPQLNIHNDLMDATRNWTPAEWAMRRRILKFWRQPNAQQIDCGFDILDEELYRSQRMQHHGQGEEDNYNPKDNLVVSCIYWQERNDYYITSVDCIQLIEGLIGVEFTVEEKNRIRRNLEALRPLTAAKTRPESVEFFKLIMGFPAPKPRNIEKDVKVFQWSTLGPAIKKIIGKYTPSYSSTASVVNHNNSDISSFPPQQQQRYHTDTPRLTRS